MNSTQLVEAYIETLRYEPISILTEGAIIDKLKKMYKHFKSRIKSATSMFKKYGIKLTDITKKGTAKFKEKLWKMYKSGVTAKEAGKKLLGEIIAFIIPFFKPMYDKFLNMGKTQKLISKLLIAAIVVALVLILNTSMVTLLTRVGISTIDAITIMAVSLGPLLEESMKTFFIGLGIPWAGTALFAVAEFVLYMKMLGTSGSQLAILAVSRVITGIMHMLFTYTQIDVGKEAEKKGDSKAKALFKGWAVASMIHMGMNTLSMIMNYEMYRGWLDPTSAAWWINLVTGKPVSFG